MSGRASIGFVDFAVFRSSPIAFVAFRSSCFWCETGAVILETEQLYVPALPVGIPDAHGHSMLGLKFRNRNPAVGTSLPGTDTF
jgi:hypothetical protein